MIIKDFLDFLVSRGVGVGAYGAYGAFGTAAGGTGISAIREPHWEQKSSCP
jgi:hypothetical protein